jgi:hypothetical protein
MSNRRETIGYFIAEIRDLEFAENATTPPKDIPLSFCFAIELEGSKLDIKRVLKTFVDVGRFPVALLWRDLLTHEVSVGYPGSLPVWLRTVVASRAPGLINDVVRCLR